MGIGRIVKNDREARASLLQGDVCSFYVTLFTTERFVHSLQYALGVLILAYCNSGTHLVLQY